VSVALCLRNFEKLAQILTGLRGSSYGMDTTHLPSLYEAGRTVPTNFRMWVKSVCLSCDKYAVHVHADFGRMSLQIGRYIPAPECILLRAARALAYALYQCK